MRPTLRKAGLALMALLGSSSTALAAGDMIAGKSVFASHCEVCHSTQSGVNKIGPSLAGIVRSKSGTVPGFNFSPALKNVEVTWDDAKLDKFLANGGLCPTDQDVRRSPQRDRSAKRHRLSQHAEGMSRFPSGV
jgi:cytochrome c2